MNKMNSAKTGKSLETLLSKIQNNEILSIEQMIRVRGGDNDIPTPILLPPTQPAPPPPTTTTTTTSSGN